MKYYRITFAVLLLYVFINGRYALAITRIAECHSIFQTQILMLKDYETTNIGIDYTQAEAKENVYMIYKKANKKLNDVYQQVLAKYKSNRLFIKNMRTAERLWIKFRDAEIAVKFSRQDLKNTDSVLSIAKIVYLTHLTEERTKILQNIFEPTKIGLIAFYPFNGNANDQSGNGHDGIVHGATLTTDRFGNPNSAYKFNGIDNSILVTLNELKRATSWTISFWVKVDSLNRGGAFSLLTATPNYRADGFWWHFWTDGTVAYRVHDGVSGQQLVNEVSAPIQAGIWQHHIITITKNQMVHYINGKSAFTWHMKFDPAKLNSDNLELRIGEGYNYENCYNLSASIDEMYVFDRTLTDEEIQGLYMSDE
jgi:uncharacterized protein YecT (DUF1311 family)